MKLFGFLPVGARDVVDVLVASFILYHILRFFRQSRAVYIFLGILLITLMGWIAQLFHLSALAWMTGLLRTIGLVAVVIIFQPEIRRVLLSLGRNPLFRRMVPEGVDPVLKEIAEACFRMANRNIGALIVIQRRDPLRDLAERGVILQARVHQDLLVSLFHPSSPLHDGAVIVDEDRLLAARVILPLLPGAEDLPEAFGTRHRAAWSITVETDAIAVVVSEERGEVRVFEHGNFTLASSQDELQNLLVEALREVLEAGEETVAA